ncbi:trans-acting regulator SP_1800 [Streptococcus canis]|uniref:helix-turn-helix domain-containing protein n=1 Tax=Streptococcus canis TaxID=1329 RepID=UPI0010E3F903|nr:helix-turn-helix domain-containing protein [Streptococcus canis]BER90456.1 M protein trans-acting positive regulator [Streptococcus canis]GFE44699.1 M protein trans-acting positive regulator [Streptococcus canis]VTS71220.1 trans-acting regulator SP_1800 [Streptococcus canis]
MMHASKLFTKQQWRELELIAHLTEHPERMGYKDRELCKVLDSTLSTLQACVANLQFMESLGRITYKDSYLSIDYNDHCGLQEVYQRALRESQSLQLLATLFFKEFDSLEDLAEALFISLSTLKRLIERTNSYLQKEFGIKISTRPVMVVGDERQIRLFYLKYFSEAYAISEWPFADVINQNNLERLIELMVKQTDVLVNFCLFQHLKILSGVNLVRFQKGFTVNRKDKGLEPLFMKALEDSLEMKDLSSLFVLKYNRPLDVKALSEIFSNYMSKELELGASLQSTIKEKNKTLSPRNIVSWISLLDNLEKTIGLSMSNKYELARHLQATVVLGEEDISANFLIYDYKREYLSYFDKHYKLIYETFIGSVKELFALAGEELSDKMISHLLYCLFITWENLFLKISHSRRKLKLLVIERSHNNVGNFLKAYFVEFFDIVNFAELEITTIDLTALEKDYDVIVTDVILERSFQTEILFFNQMIPSVVADKLNAFLRLKIGEDKLFSKINITI